MALKTQTIKLGVKEIVIKELSFAGQLRLELKETASSQDIWAECVESWKEIIESLTRPEGLELVKAINELNGWTKKDDAESKG